MKSTITYQNINTEMLEVPNIFSSMSIEDSSIEELVIYSDESTLHLTRCNIGTLTVLGKGLKLVIRDSSVFVTEGNLEFLCSK